MPHLNSFFILFGNQRPNLMLFIQHSCLIHVDQLSLSCWRERPAPEKWTLESASSDCRIFLSHTDLLSAVEMLETEGCLNSRIFGWSISVLVDVWCMTSLCMSAWIPENWWMLQSDGLFLVETQWSARMCLQHCWQCLSCLGSWGDLMGQKSTALVQRKY